MFGFLKKLLGGASGPPPVTAQEAQALMKQGAVMVDVRTHAERKSGFIPGSKHIPLNELGSKLGQLPRDKPIICQCASGNRSAAAVQTLSSQGLDAHNLKGGISAWRLAGLPIKDK